MSDLPDQRAHEGSTAGAAEGAAPSQQEAAGEAAQHVVDEVTSWSYSAERDTVEAQLDEGLDEAGVRLPDEERQRVLEEIDELKHDETRGAPHVRSADVADEA